VTPSPRRLLPLPLLLLLPLASRGETPPAAPPPAALSLYAGAAGIFDDDTFACAAAGFRPAVRWFRHFGPDFLVGTGRHGEFYAAAGLFLDLPLGERLVLAPSFGVGYYNSAAHGCDLGFDLQFCSTLRLDWRFASGFRAGIAFSHLSNGALSDYNPGIESLFLTIAAPLGRRLR